MHMCLYPCLLLALTAATFAAVLLLLLLAIFRGTDHQQQQRQQPSLALWMAARLRVAVQQKGLLWQTGWDLQSQERQQNFQVKGRPL